MRNGKGCHSYNSDPITDDTHRTTITSVELSLEPNPTIESSEHDRLIISSHLSAREAHSFSWCDKRFASVSIEVHRPT